MDPIPLQTHPCPSAWSRCPWCRGQGASCSSAVRPGSPQPSCPGSSRGAPWIPGQQGVPFASGPACSPCPHCSTARRAGISVWHAQKQGPSPAGSPVSPWQVGDWFPAPTPKHHCPVPASQLYSPSPHPSEMADFAESRRRAVTVEQGGAVLIACLMPPSTPPALPRLRVRGEWLEQSTDEYLILPSGNLQIASASPHHQGVYKCGAYNPVTQETRLETHGTKLAVRQPRGLSPLRLIHPLVPQTLVVQQSNDITLECILEGSQAPQVRWTKDGQEVAMGSSHRMVLNNLLLMGVGPSDSGTYQCSASSRTGGMVTANYTIVVQGARCESILVLSSCSCKHHVSYRLMSPQQNPPP
uniref:Ig-like domain-containing protein n=1 Tax=Paramormyrops kingsleyae TaxID=1676925 RepID=A0A3B3SVR0_9TELE